MYTLRTAPCFRSDVLESYDDCLREILGSVANTLLARNSSAWVQATLPMKLGGLGIRDAVSVALSAFLASSHSTAELVEAILPPHISALPAPHLEEAMLLWSAGHSHPAPEGAAASWQRAGSWQGTPPVDHTSAGIAQWRWMCLGDTHSVARRVRADISGTQP